MRLLALFALVVLALLAIASTGEAVIQILNKNNTKNHPFFWPSPSSRSASWPAAATLDALAPVWTAPTRSAVRTARTDSSASQDRAPANPSALSAAEERQLRAPDTEGGRKKGPDDGTVEKLENMNLTDEQIAEYGMIELIYLIS